MYLYVCMHVYIYIKKYIFHYDILTCEQNNLREGIVLLKWAKKFVK